MTKPKYACPKCGSANLSVAITTTAYLVQEADGNFQTTPSDDHEWDDFSTMSCNECGACDRAASFAATG